MFQKKGDCLMPDVLVVGCGLTGSVIARELAEQGKKVEIWERRDHIGGNMYDYKDEYGILVQKYGPHAFHTNNKSVVDYITRFDTWKDFHLACRAEIDGVETPSPFNFQTIDDFYTAEDARTLKEHIKNKFGNRETATVTEVLNCSDPLVSGYARFLFDKDYSLYTAKQWGISPAEIDPSVLARVPLRFSYADGYFEDEYQLMPAVSYTHFFEKLLDHPNISVKLSIEALEHLKVAEDYATLFLDGGKLNIPVVYTGTLDELFGCVEGRLPYRSLRFEWKHEDLDNFQTAAVVAYPQAEGYTRITEYKKLPPQDVSGTTYAVEYPLSYFSGKENEPYYPVPTEESKKQYAKYCGMAAKIKNLIPCGRLADFKYYNMDQALERALEVSESIR